MIVVAVVAGGGGAATSMAPGAFSILAPFLRRKVKKYERLDTEDPERRKQEATMEELSRINIKIVSYHISSVVRLTLDGNSDYFSLA